MTAVDELNATQAVARRAAGLRFEDLTPAAVTVAKQCLLDWIGVCVAARRDPLVDILVDERMEAGLRGDAIVVGRAQRLALPAAVLVNGAMSHALDYDDVHQAMNGHPSVPLMPVVLGLGTHMRTAGRAALAAFVAGFETECRIGALCGRSHYARGFHPTATLGTFGATAAAAHLLGLDTARVVTALGLAGTQAAGLKSAFGTHCKPLHAGRAAEVGLLSARLAARGFTAQQDILGNEQGFARTQSDEFDRAACEADPPGGFHVTSTLFKFHAACFLTHSSIEALKRLRDHHLFSPGDVQAVTLHVNDAHLKICNIAQPRTGLEVKFSLRMMAALALAGVDTANELSYTDALAARPDLVALRDKVTVAPCGDMPGSRSRAEVVLAGGTRFEATHDVGEPLSDLQHQWELLETKFRALVAPALGAGRAEALVRACRNAHALDDLGELLELTIPA